MQAADGRHFLIDDGALRMVSKDFHSVGKLKSEGKAILFISHKFEEIFRIADRYAVFRDGRSVGSGMVSDATPSKLISLMVGRSVDTPQSHDNLYHTVLGLVDVTTPTYASALDAFAPCRKGAS